ncbi:MAG TPA: glycosyltransferase [Vicinamibacterales bacterium]|nr:glycosyltransferase [Vicinamibacterales bacterium]
MTSTPLVTVVIPCFNQARYLGDAVQSVRAQGYPTIECIVVDDASADGTAALARTLAVRVVEQRVNQGVSAARNAGLAAAHGDLVVFLDADDELLPDAIEHHAGALAAHPHATAVVGRCEAMDGDGNPLPVSHHAVDPSRLYEEWLSRNFVWTPGAAMFRRRELEALGGFPAMLGPAADYSLYMQLARADRIVYVPVPIVRYRQHDASMSRDPALMLRATLAALRRERIAAPQWAHAAIRRGHRVWCDWYGEQIVHRLRRDWRARRFGPTELQLVATLVRHCPGLIARHATRKMRLGLGSALGRAWRQILQVPSTLRKAAR